jgi:hypothetical protein
MMQLLKAQTLTEDHYSGTPPPSELYLILKMTTEGTAQGLTGHPAWS